ncbi:MAG: serine hydroxymethyltransferase [Candidatus Lambdaproteobacteria bacterium]|nr:serine hydroxymethyltransferase [Candidatus Lambdaproteobacteria bacterium]
MNYSALPQGDPEVFRILQGEYQREHDGLELIPSENYVSEAVLEALGTLMTNKYSEGTPGRRYYGGQTYTDQVESLAIARAKALFNADHANVQPLSGAAANLCVYAAWLELGDTVLAMDLSHGGHLTHGAPVTFAAKAFKFIRYKMKDVETGEIDYDHLERLALEHKPKIILAGFSAYPRSIDYPRMKAIADKVGAMAMADMAHIAGLIAGKALPNPLDAGFHVMTTTTHKTLRGPRGAVILSRGTPGNPLRAPEKTLENLPTLIDRAVFPGLQGGPHMNKVMAIAVALKEAATPAFRQYARQVLANAQALAAQLMERGCKLVTNGTDNHMMLLDTMASFGKTGQEVQELLDAVGMTLNKNALPDDPLPPFKASGVRLGTPAATSRGMKEPEMERVAGWIVDACQGRAEPAQIAAQVKALCNAFPSPSGKVQAG